MSGSSACQYSALPLSMYLDLLVDGLQELALMVAHSGTVNLLDQLGVFVDKPCLSQHIGCCVFYLGTIHI